MANGEWVEDSYWFYAPNHGAAIFFTLAFLCTTVVHFWQCYHYKFAKVTGLFVLCGLLFVGGFALRAYGSWHYDNLDVMIASICLVYASPPLLELANYHILGRLLYYVPYHSPLHPGRVLSTFAFLSFIVEGLNGWGASYTANLSLPGASRATGHALMKASLIIQIAVILFFLAITAVFHRRCASAGLARAKGVRGPLITLYASVALLLVRTIYRIVEHFGLAGIDWWNMDAAAISPVIRYEWFFYVFESAFMLVNMVMWNIRHPRRYLPADYHVFLERDGVTETRGKGFEDTRPMWATIVDPFNIGGMFSKGSGDTEYERQKRAGSTGTEAVEEGTKTSGV
ncbi:hypothetical protein B0T11DRAFT_272648 [Plectosphaerella cucumerina]|uniref:Uncharacterized protein n=1 Tax=Plectosphaerella cucumerina TaxID=40658 RepID=A0A8K0XA74_9PEZI|nr:hypothetical protein B0T11DRAFT_272648 [Plectosphaerella cucumerina]